MTVEIIAVGTEILLGNIVNTNAAYLAEKCAGLGLSCYHQDVVGDNEERLMETIRLALTRADIILLSGGLGPTQDDLTKEAAAKVMGKELYLHEPSREAIRQFFAERNLEITENNWKQAMVPEGAVVVENPGGTAPGIIIAENGKHVVLMPGPPGELIPMFEERYPNIMVEGTYDSSGKLQAQIEEGLEADVFMSAAAKQMDALEEKGMVVSETRANLLENRIVLIVPSGSELGLSSFADIVKADAIALGDPASVPAGQYAKEALTFLGIWEEIQGRASFGTNVTEVLNQVAAASAEAGIVYATDAASMAGQVEIAAEAPEGSLSQRVLYPAAVLKGSAHFEEAGRFVEFLKTPEAMEVFAAYGFTDGGK